MAKDNERNIYLLRHGKILLPDSERRYIGHLDLPLSEEGVKQARRLQRIFADKAITSIYSSSLIRSIKTAEMISEGLNAKLTVRSDLSEISMGEWEGRLINEVACQHPEEYTERGANIATYCIPGAESFVQCQARIISAFGEIMDSTNGDVIIVSHAGANRTLLCHILGMPIENLFRISQNYGCINVLAEVGGKLIVKSLNSFAITDYR